MSGGFFRGTSADQDTRFSNKQAKLLKSQKFAAELENLVDMTKVKMDVMKPWIAKRVTELIGFEDEVLINFIYGLLEGKAVNGKQVQIQLTGFMERNTGKFMKELWVLLLSAQQNVSGVPQPFLDAKEEEFKIKAESDRIANENRMRKEKDNKELDQEKTRMDNDGENAREKRAVRELDRKHEPDHTADPRKDGSRGRSRGSGSSESGSGSPPIRRKHSMSPSKSPSSRSHSKERQGSRSFTRVTRSRSRSVSSERPRHSSRRRSVTPRPECNTRRSHSRSPLGRRSFYSNRGSVSPARRRSPSPRRNRFRPPLRYRSRSPLRRRSRSPIKRRSRTPPRYRSRSPVRRRSPSPLRRRSPVRRRSPPPARRRSPPPARRRSPPPARRRSPSPVRSPSLSRSISRSPVRRPYRHTSSSPHNLSTSPVRGRPSMHDQKRSSPVPRRSPSPQYSSSQSPTRPSSLSPRRRASPRRVAKSPSQSPDHQDSIKERPELKNSNGSKAVARKPTVSQMATQRDMLEQNDLRRKERDSQKASIGAEGSRDSSRKGGRRASSPRGSPYQKREGASPPENLSTLPKAAELKPSHEISETNKDDRERFSRREIGDHKYRSSGRASQTPVQPKDSLDSAVTSGLAKSRKTQSTDSDRLSDKVDNREFGLSGKGKDTHVDSERSNHLSEMESLPELSKMSEKNGLTESPLKKLDDPNTKVKEKRKHKRSDADSDDYSSNDSYGEKREAKKRRKEEKKLKKQERRKRREERRLRKQGRREEKLKSKAVDRGSSSSNSEADDSLDAEAEKKRIEIELREKALESLRAKRGIGN